MDRKASYAQDRLMIDVLCRLMNHKTDRVQQGKTTSTDVTMNRQTCAHIEGWRADVHGRRGDSQSDSNT